MLCNLAAIGAANLPEKKFEVQKIEDLRHETQINIEKQAIQFQFDWPPSFDL